MSKRKTMSSLKKLYEKWRFEGGCGAYNDWDAGYYSACADHATELSPSISREDAIWQLLSDCIDNIRGGGEINTPKKIELFERAMRLGYDQNHNRSKSP